MNRATATAQPPFPFHPQPPRRRRAFSPANAELLILLVYARHLRDIVARLAERALSCLMQCFDSPQAGFVLANLARGILRAIALQRVSAGGESPAAGDPRKRTQPAAQPASARHPARARSVHGGLVRLPTLRQLEAAIRRQTAERAIDAIRRDFGISLSLCEPRFGNALRDVIAAYRDTISGFFAEFPRQEALVTDAPGPDSTAHSPPRQRDGSVRTIVASCSREPARGFSRILPPFAAVTAEAHPP